MKEIATFIYKISFYEESGSFIDSEIYSVEIELIDDPEQVRDDACSKIDDLADEALELFDAHSYEIELIDVC